MAGRVLSLGCVGVATGTVMVIVDLGRSTQMIAASSVVNGVTMPTIAVVAGRRVVPGSVSYSVIDFTWLAGLN